MMRFRRSIFPWIIILASLWLSACQVMNPGAPTPTPSSPPAITPTQPPAPTPTDARLKGTVTIWHGWDEQKRPALLKVIQDFQAQYPDVIFDVQYVPPIDLKAAFEAASLDGAAPDILIGDGAWGPEWYDQGWVADLTDLAPSDLINSLNPAGIEAARYHNALMGLPVSLEGVVLYRNRNIILASAETLDEMIAFARQVTEGDVYGTYLERSFFYSGGHLMGVGGSLMDAQGYPAFNDSYGLAWIDLLRSFERFGLVDFYSDNDVQYFTENRAGYIIESTRLRNRLVEAMGTASVAIDPWPLLDQGSMSGFVQSENVYLSPAGAAKEGQVALKFVEMLLTPPSQAYLAETGSIPALRASTAFAPGSQFSTRNDLVEQAMVALEDGHAYPVVPQMAVYPPQMDIALQSIFQDGVPADQALASAEAAIIQALDTPTEAQP
jgi:arabinogalactan oligomer/maltooligosaccharide transport system substrate-binding protein